MDFAEVSGRSLVGRAHPIRDHLVKRSIEVDRATTEGRKHDLVLVPGGHPALFVGDQELVDEFRRLSDTAKRLASVCTCALLVSKTGLADGKTVTFHWDFVELHRRQFPAMTVAAEHRYYQDGMRLVLVIGRHIYWDRHDAAVRCRGVGRDGRKEGPGVLRVLPEAATSAYFQKLSARAAAASNPGQPQSQRESGKQSVAGAACLAPRHGRC